MSEPVQNGWSSHQLLVLSKLTDLGADIKEIKQEQARQGTEIAMLKVKSGVWGALAGLVPFGLFVAYQVMGPGGSA